MTCEDSSLRLRTWEVFRIQGCRAEPYEGICYVTFRTPVTERYVHSLIRSSSGLRLPHVRPQGPGVYQVYAGASCGDIASVFPSRGSNSIWRGGWVSTTYQDSVVVGIANGTQGWVEGEGKLFTAEGLCYQVLFPGQPKNTIPAPVSFPPQTRAQTSPLFPENPTRKIPSLLLSCCAVIATAVAHIAPVRSDLDTGSLTLLTYRTIAFHVGSLLVFLIHGD